MRVEASQSFGQRYQFFGQHYTKFDSADQKFGCLNFHHFLVVVTKNEGQPDKNFVQPNQIAIWLSQPLQKVESAYKISMSVNRVINS